MNIASRFTTRYDAIFGSPTSMFKEFAKSYEFIFFQSGDYIFIYTGFVFEFNILLIVIRDRFSG